MFFVRKQKVKSYLIYNYVKTANFHIWETRSKEYFSLLSIKPATQICQITQISVRTVKTSKSKLVHPFLFQSVSSGSQGRQSGSCCQISCKLASLSSEGGGRRTKIGRTEVKSPIQQILWNSALWRTDSINFWRASFKTISPSPAKKIKKKLWGYNRVHVQVFSTVESKRTISVKLLGYRCCFSVSPIHCFWESSARLDLWTWLISYLDHLARTPSSVWTCISDA